MSSRVIEQLPQPPEYFSKEEIRIWQETGAELIRKRLLRKSSIRDLESLVFWESQKNRTLENLNGDFTKDQLELLKGGRLKFHSSVLLSNYKAIQDEINELRLEFGLQAESPQYISNTPLIPDDAYQNLPTLLKNCCRHINDPRNRDTFLLYSLPVLAFHLAEIQFEHAEGVFGPNIKSFVLNPQGTVNTFARRSVDLAAVLDEESIKRNSPLAHPVISSTADLNSIKKMVTVNRGKALLFDEKYAFLRNSNNQQTELFRDLVDSSFRNKMVALPKENDDRYTVTPSLCISQCGSIDDLKGIVELYGEEYLNNFLFYIHDQSLDWQSVRPTNETKRFLESIRTLSEKMHQLYTMCLKRNSKLFVVLDDSHWQMIDDTFKEKVSIIEELGLMQQLNGMLQKSSIYVVKIAVLFRMIGMIEENIDIKNLQSVKTRDEDLAASLWIVDTLMKHSIRIYQNLPVMKENVRGDRYHRFYNVLPIIFDTSQALEVASRISIPSRTANRYLSTYLESNFLSKLRKGVYYKREL